MPISRVRAFFAMNAAYSMVPPMPTPTTVGGQGLPPAEAYQLLPELTVLENVMLSGMLFGLSKKNAKAKALELLENVGLADRIKHHPNEMSGGEQQRAAIARALLNSPELLLADEPTGNLDKNNGEAILELFKKLHSENRCTIVMITHSEAVADCADKIYRIENGIIC